MPSVVVAVAPCPRRASGLVIALLLLATAPVRAQQGPSFDCSKATHEAEQLVCKDPALSALDRTLAGVYQAAAKKATNEHPPVLAATQRGWIKGRDECWKAKDQRACVEQAYVQRIAELQASYRLVAPNATARYACNGDPRNEVVATYFPTDPRTTIVERGDETSLMYAQPTASGTFYQGRNESLREHQGVVTVVWGYGAPELTCRATK